jgi:hypothetical protein
VKGGGKLTSGGYPEIIFARMTIQFKRIKGTVEVAKKRQNPNTQTARLGQTPNRTQIVSKTTAKALEYNHTQSDTEHHRRRSL